MVYIFLWSSLEDYPECPFLLAGHFKSLQIWSRLKVIGHRWDLCDSLVHHFSHLSDLSPQNAIFLLCASTLENLTGCLYFAYFSKILLYKLPGLSATEIISQGNIKVSMLPGALMMHGTLLARAKAMWKVLLWIKHWREAKNHSPVG